MWEQLVRRGRSLAKALNSPFLVERVQNYFGVYRLAKNGQQNGGARNGYAAAQAERPASGQYRVERPVWYHLFRFGSLLGYEAFYATFFPFILWNWDAVVCRRVLLTWALVMYCGGLAKDLLRWPRPASPPVVQLDRAYAAEFGMPSTHAMTGATVPFGLLLWTQQRYEYCYHAALCVCLVWCALLCVSRLYLGMHTVLDLLVGLVVAWALLLPLVSVSVTLEAWMLAWPWGAPLCAALLLLAYPAPPRWTPARGDTCLVVATVAGIWAGEALLPMALGTPTPTPVNQGAGALYTVEYVSLLGLSFIVARTVVGLVASVLVRTVVKAVIYPLLCGLHGCDPKLETSRQKGTIELPYKYITYLSMGLTMSLGSPWLFHQLGIERDSLPIHL
ncbi:sphingosine-1-phosphate phosphatase 2-like isoform X2 [Dermacentor andersoni]|uniref:sphingosine-1-phosphate phosphatase 2-like isoform X2 n=1 Tax=Dermacentor andersoni TaxID=34620 RepID=UPI002155EBD4|nr:sphingosine-1-phosphate phosphatase 2-like isoform X1 [Dermacentor andersoni]